MKIKRVIVLRLLGFTVEGLEPHRWENPIFFRGVGWYSLSSAGNYVKGIIPTHSRIRVS